MKRSSLEKEQINYLATHGFILAIFALFLNDFLIKPLLPGNLVAGKLSDFAGLFAFYIFLRATTRLQAIRLQLIILIGFTWWKSPLSEDFIIFWNKLNFIYWERTVDYTDLLALIVLPCAEIYLSKAVSIGRSKLLQVNIIVFSLFVFMATSVPGYHVISRGKQTVSNLNYQHSIPYKLSEIAEKLEEIGFYIFEGSCAFNLCSRKYKLEQRFEVHMSSKASEYLKSKANSELIKFLEEPSLCIMLINFEAEQRSDHSLLEIKDWYNCTKPKDVTSEEYENILKCLIIDLAILGKESCQL